jgi:hypothetical protein
MDRRWSAVQYMVVAVALLGSSCAAVSTPRLRETPLALVAQDHVLMQGAAGPERVAGYFQLKRKWVSRVMCTLIQLDELTC